MRIILVRHAEPQISKHLSINILLGQKNVGLSEEGEYAAKEFAKEVAYDLISSNSDDFQLVSSNLKRSIQTAAYLCIRYNQRIKIIADLKEIDLGELTDKDLLHLTDKQKQMWTKLNTEYDYKGHGGESQREFINRAERGFEKVVLGADSDCIIVILHEGVMRAILSQVLRLRDREHHYDYLESVILEREFDIWNIVDRSIEEIKIPNI